MKSCKIIGFDEFCSAIAAIKTGCNYDPRRDMYFIDPETVNEWGTSGSWHVPTGISSICGHCGTLTTFSKFSYSGTDAAQAIVTMTGKCPKCAGVVSFFILGCSRFDLKQPAACQSIWMLPEPTPVRLAISFESSQIPDRVLSAYKSSIQCFNNKIWTATVTECGRTLEGVAIDKIPNWNADKTLDKSIKGLSEELGKTGYLELFEPIIDLANVLRLGRNKSAHFDLTQEPNEHVAFEVLELTEKLLDYFYLIPRRSRELESSIRNLEP